MHVLGLKHRYSNIVVYKKCTDSWCENCLVACLSAFMNMRSRCLASKRDQTQFVYQRQCQMQYYSERFKGTVSWDFLTQVSLSQKIARPLPSPCNVVQFNGSVYASEILAK